MNEVGTKNYWLKVVAELGALATKRGAPVMSVTGDMDEIDFLCMRLKQFRNMELKSTPTDAA